MAGPYREETAMLRLALLVIALALPALQTSAEERQEGYYYPKITSREVFDRALGPREATRQERIELAIALNRRQIEQGFARVAVFTKGAAAEKLIIVALDDNVFRTHFRARAYMALLTSQIRDTPYFRRAGLSEDVTFYDVLYMMNFDSLTLSDGANWAHQVTFREAK
ncbi:MAG: hypothetical protein D6754_14850 [Alphaproteobacteria bacterium]|nr:MAG: hypothetical protein D6754_14850 [Alphaproteobacteria bacterium]